MIIPLQDKIIVERQEAQNMYGQIVIPDNAREVPYKGTVIAVGPGMYVNGVFCKIADDIKVGDVVIFNRRAGFEIENDGRKQLIIRESEIIAKELPKSALVS